MALVFTVFTLFQSGRMALCGSHSRSQMQKLLQVGRRASGSRAPCATHEICSPLKKIRHTEKTGAVDRAGLGKSQDAALVHIRLGRKAILKAGPVVRTSGHMGRGSGLRLLREAPKPLPELIEEGLGLTEIIAKKLPIIQLSHEALGSRGLGICQDSLGLGAFTGCRSGFLA